MNFNLPPDEGKKKRSVYWNACIVLGLIGWGFWMSGWQRGGAETGAICGGFLCCFSLIFAISALSTPNDNKQVVVIQQQPQYVPVVQQPRPIAKPDPPTYVSKKMWANEAGNLVLARNWEEAAKAYEKAGMYAEAGRIRKEHLEDKQPIVKIGKVGDTILHDSVMISDDSENDV
tara:strand:+ start:1316 stop:1837 length:522 start_codon:yes stop_codon:yes gene_type:complete